MLDKNKDGYLDFPEFFEGMNTIFTDDYRKQTKFIFDLYDFDKDSLISKEDVRVVNSYIPLKTKRLLSEVKSKFVKENFCDRAESQEELHGLLERCFGINEQLDYAKFLKCIEEVSSDIFLFVNQK